MSTMKLNYFEISRISTIDAQKVLATIEEDEMHPGRKRRRLDNLNVEERILRRKLKNRVAAQTARDRKKAHMDDLEITIQRIEKENKFLKKSNEELRSQVHQLSESNLRLHTKLGLTPPASPSQDHTCITIPQKNNSEPIITPSVSDHDHIVIKKEESANEHAVESHYAYSSSLNQDMREESQTELLLDVLGDEEPIRVPKQHIYASSNETAGHRVEIIEDSSSADHTVPTIKNIKQEEFDVDDFLSYDSNEIVCPSSPESQPSSPGSSDGYVDIEDLVHMCCSKTKASVVGDSTFDGHGITSNQFIDDEFLLSCESNLNSSNSMVDMYDPFSDLFPSLLSV